MSDYVAYYRVSTDRQGESGLGLEAQRETVSRYIEMMGGTLLDEFTEVESGAKRNRPELDTALSRCKRLRATLVIAKLDRLARNVHFISGLLESGVEFVACDNPNANKMMVQMLAVFAEHEREMISRRTKDALKAAKARGVRLGSFGKELGRRNMESANAFAKELAPVIQEIKSDGLQTAKDIAHALNERGIKGRMGGRWHAQSVINLLARL
ncbi:recombinase family protein [Terasakiella sp.]|uniref:recombinase family protein n=1 Tax=Terasakiella sp. TaxID=2034861 RepID=UPI003AA9075F